MKILITGANGFVGRALTNEAFSRGINTRLAVRRFSKFNTNMDVVLIDHIDANTNWFNALIDCDVVIHLAAKVHVRNSSNIDDLSEFRRVNVEGTLNLARQAFSHRVQRFIFISSIGVNGAETFNLPFSNFDVPSPHSFYSVSKYEAELGLLKLASELSKELVIIRPPLVYGPNAPGNFGYLLRMIRSNLPLPFGAISQNRRSFIALDNLIDFILTCVKHPKAANQTFLVSDGEDLSTLDLLRKLGKAMNRSVLMLPIPFIFLSLIATFFGRSAEAKSLLGSLQLDTSWTRELLDWNPPISVDEGIRRSVIESRK